MLRLTTYLLNSTKHLWYVLYYSAMILLYYVIIYSYLHMCLPCVGMGNIDRQDAAAPRVSQVELPLFHMLSYNSNINTFTACLYTQDGRVYHSDRPSRRPQLA